MLLIESMITACVYDCRFNDYDPHLAGIINPFTILRNLNETSMKFMLISVITFR